MSRHSALRLLPLLIAALACSTLRPPPAPTATALPTQTAPPASAAPTRVPPSPTVAPTFTPAPAPSLTPAPAPAGAIVVQPGPLVYSGDRLSLAVAGQPEWQGAQVNIFHGGPAGQPIVSGSFGGFGLSDRLQATFWWAWDTTGLTGPQTLTAVVEPAAGGAPLATLTQTITLLPADQRPAPEAQARWAQTQSACCIFHYLTGTAAERDIDQIKTEADRAFARVAQILQVQPVNKVSFTLLSRLLGHGGFADSEISITYIDRNPAGLDLPTVFAHEGTHILDREIARERPVIMAEGLAVYVAGGHYHPEDLDQRAAALLALDRYLPLRALARDFYTSQHEIGYLEAGAFIKYLVDRFGWERFRAFYGSFETASDDAEMLADGLARAFGQSLETLEADWLDHLRALPPDPAAVEHLRLTLALFDTLRRYQQLDDPAAYFLTAWLPNGPEARRRGLTADFIRSPRAAENIALETMLTEAEADLTRANFTEAEALIQSVNAVLAAGNLFFDPLAARYLRVVTDLSARGYEAQRIDLAGAAPHALAIRAWPTLEMIPLYNSGQ